MRLILLGAPGAGKGTQAHLIMNKFGIPHISTGDMIRTAVQEKSAFGKQAKVFLDANKLVTDTLVIAMVKERIKQDDCRHGFLLDGFPRTLPQAYAMKAAGITVDYVLELSVPDMIIIERIVGRLVHSPSGRIYHVIFNPPKNEGKDDVTGELLTTRTDDQKDKICQRLVEYHEQTSPLIDYYRKEADKGSTSYLVIDGTRNINEINTELTAIFN